MIFRAWPFIKTILHKNLPIFAGSKPGKDDHFLPDGFFHIFWGPDSGKKSLRLDRVDYK